MAQATKSPHPLQSSRLNSRGPTSLSTGRLHHIHSQEDHAVTQSWEEPSPKLPFLHSLIPYSIACLLCTDILPGVSPSSRSDQVPASGALPASAAPEMSFLPRLGNVKSHILCLSLLLAEQTPVKTKPRSDGRRKTWWEGAVSINKTLLVSSTKDYPGVPTRDYPRVPHSVIQGVSLPQSKLKTVSGQRGTVICQELPRPEVILSEWLFHFQTAL